MKLLNWFVNLIPEQYRVAVAIKKVSYSVGKLAAGLITAKLVTNGKLTADQVTQIQAGITTGVAATLTFIQDWAKMKWPNATWL